MKSVTRRLRRRDDDVEQQDFRNRDRSLRHYEAGGRDGAAQRQHRCPHRRLQPRGPRHWKIVSDASVPDGFEVVSPVLKGEQGLGVAKVVVETLNAAQAGVDVRCGLHAHFGASDLTAAEIATVVRRYRRGNANRFCRSVRSILQSASVMQKLASRSTDEAFGTRYAKVNLEAYRRHRTIEFRQHRRGRESLGLDPLRLELYRGKPPRRRRHQHPGADPLEQQDGTVMTMLSRMGGARIDDLIAATGWQRHTLRAAICTQLRKRGLEVVSRRENGTTVYAIINRAVDAGDHVMAGIDIETATYLRRRARAA